MCPLIRMTEQLSPEKNALLATIIFFVGLVIVLALLTTISPFIAVRNEFLVVALVLLAVYLIFSGRISEISGWGLTLKIRVVSKSSIIFSTIQDIPVDDIIGETRAFNK